MSNTLINWLQNTEANFSNKMAFFDGSDAITFHELLDQTKEIAASLETKAGTVTPLSIRRDVFAPASFLGFAMANAGMAPIPEEFPQDRVQEVIISTIMGAMSQPTMSQASTNQPIMSQASTNQPTMSQPSANQTSLTQTSMLQGILNQEPSTPYLIFQTSGSSGKSKGVCLSQENVSHYIESFGLAMEITSQEVLGSQASFDYVACLRDIFLPVRYGCSTVIIPKEYFVNPKLLHEFLQENYVTTLCWSVSAMTTVAKLGALEDYDFSFVKKVIFTGSQINGGILRRWQMALPEAKFINHYGPSEATASCTYYVVDHVVKTFEEIPIGDTLPGYDIFLLPAPMSDELGAKARIDKQYEICVAGPGLAMGYYNEPELTASRFEIRDDLDTPEPVRIYHTGDLGKVVDGNLVYCGRMDRMIKHMDYRVELDGIERLVLSMVGIKDAAVVNDKYKDKICLYFMTEPVKKLVESDNLTAKPDDQSLNESRTSAKPDDQSLNKSRTSTEPDDQSLNESKTLVESAEASQQTVEAGLQMQEIPVEEAFEWVEATEGDVINFLKKKLPHYMIPRKTEKVEVIPKLANGKTDYQSIEAKFIPEKKSVPKLNLASLTDEET